MGIQQFFGDQEGLWCIFLDFLLGVFVQCFFFFVVGDGQGFGDVCIDFVVFVVSGVEQMWWEGF